MSTKQQRVVKAQPKQQRVVKAQPKQQRVVKVTRRVVRITPTMSKVKIPGSNELTVGEVTSLDRIIRQGEARGRRWTLYRLPDERTLEVLHGYMTDVTTIHLGNEVLWESQ